jgi:hypothetical protein
MAISMVVVPDADEAAMSPRAALSNPLRALMPRTRLEMLAKSSPIATQGVRSRFIKPPAEGLPHVAGPLL